MTPRTYKVTFTHPLFPGQTGEMNVKTDCLGGNCIISAEGFPESSYGRTSPDFAVRHFMSCHRAEVVSITEVSAAVTVDVTKVRCTYSGKPGCCCGCRGQYRFASAFRNEAEEARGYEITDDEVSDRSVAMTVKKINDLIASGVKPMIDAAFVSVDTPTRTYTAYFTNDA